MKKIVTIVGARPQFIKAAVVSKEIAKRVDLSEVMIHTGQHFDEKMSDIFFKQMGIAAPKYFLNINSSSHGEMTGKMIASIEQVLIEEKPDWVLLYGDTNSTLAGAIAASKLHVKIAHVEAGLRSFDMKMPEEINRILTDRVSSKLFCPTEAAKSNLIKEGFSNFSCDIVVSGDVMYDAALYFSKVKAFDPSLGELLEKTEGFVLATIHRAENTDDNDRLKQIFLGLEAVQKNMKVVMPLHPRTQKKLHELNIHPKISFLPPVGYCDMLKLLQNCRMVVTDSGGLQKEAYFFKKYCITARDQTEWVELVNHKCNMLVGASSARIEQAFLELFNKTWCECPSFYGAGNASENIADQLSMGVANG